MIQFRNLTMQSFMSYRDKQVIQLANQGIVRIEGVNEDDPTADSNMSGKSTIVEAVLWCLFGRTLRGLKHGQIVNRRSGKNCFVSVTFVSEGKTYLCRRNRKHARYSNRLLLYRKDVLISSRHEAHTQRRLEHILDCDYEGFVNSVVFGGFDSGTRKQFALQSDSQQKQILDSFLKFEKFEIALQRTKHALEEARERSGEIVLAIARYSERVSASKSRLVEIKRRRRLFDQTKRSETLRIRKKIESIKNACNKPSRKDLKQARQKVEHIIEQKAGAEERASGIQRQLQEISKRRSNREKLIGKNCPTCGSLVKTDTVGALLKHLNRDRHRLKSECRLVEETIERLDRRLTYGRRELKRLQEQQRRCQESLSRKRQLEERLKSAEASSSLFSEELEDASTQYSKQVSRLLVCKYEEQVLKNRIKDLQFWETGFGNKGVKALIVRKALPAMNAKLREYTQRLFEGDVQLEFRASKETQKGDERELFNIRYHTKRNAESYIAESSGGRRRVDICVLLVFAWLSRTCNMLFIDEILDGLDASGRERVLEILSNQRGTVFVVSHNRELQSRIGTVWTVRKKNGVSSLEITNG